MILQISKIAVGLSSKPFNLLLKNNLNHPIESDITLMRHFGNPAKLVVAQLYFNIFAVVAHVMLQFFWLLVFPGQQFVPSMRRPNDESSLFWYK